MYRKSAANFVNGGRGVQWLSIIDDFISWRSTSEAFRSPSDSARLESLRRATWALFRQLEWCVRPPASVNLSVG
jgi:hypothetical protein